MHGHYWAWMATGLLILFHLSFSEGKRSLYNVGHDYGNGRIVVDIMRSWLYRLCNVCRQDIHIFKLPCATYQFYLINLVTMVET